jgi:D-alanyl-D-alanine carboxypeptidase
MRIRIAAVAAMCAIGVAATVPATASPRQDDPLQQRLTTLVKEDGFRGVVAAVQERDGRTRHYTAASGDSKVPRNGRVRLGSNTKVFTAVVVLQLVGEGKVGLEEKIDKYLPGIGVDGRGITVRQLLQHTSGLADYDQKLLKDLFATLHTYFEPRELLDAALSEKSDTVRGEWGYANTNYVLAGLLVQKITGRPIGEEITKRIIDRIGLRDTYWPNVGEQTIRGAHPRGYLAMKRGDEWVDVTESDPSPGWAAGTLIGTPADLNQFMVALTSGKLLKPAQLAEMQKTVPTPQFDLSGGARYGLGIATFDLSCGGFAWTHGGASPGYAVFNAVTKDGKAASIGITGLARDITDLRHMESALDTALCS